MERGLCLAATHLSAIAQWKGRVGESPQTLADVLEFEKPLDLKIERLYHYASLQLAEDSANPDYLARMGQLQNLLTKVSEAFAFVDAGNSGDRRRKVRAVLERSSAGVVENQAEENSPDEAARPLRTRGTPARAGRVRRSMATTTRSRN